MLLTVMLFLESAIHLTTSQPASPCPSVFQYQLDEKGIWWGMVLVTPVPSNVLLKVSVEMFVHASLPSKYAGKLLLKDGKEKVAERIVRGDSQPIVYQILFPTQNPLPVINMITANEKRICIGSQGWIQEVEWLKGGKSTGWGLESRLKEGGGCMGQNDKYRGIRPLALLSASLKPILWDGGREGERCGVASQPTKVSFRTNKNRWITETVDGASYQIGPSNTLLASSPTTDKKLKIFLPFQFRHLYTPYELSTAHCLRYRERVELTIETLVVYLGRFNLKKFSEQDAQQVELEQLAIHPDYDSYKYDADLAVLVMKRSIVYNTFIQPICLWDRSPNLGPIVGKFGTVVGWGRDENGNKVTPKPRMAQIPIVTQEECLRSKNDFVFLTSNRTFCAGSRNGTGPCNGDSGSGFILPLPDGTGSGKRWYLRGVVSLSLLDSSTWSCDLNQFVVYTDVAKYATWIQQFRT
uniref:Peptidase S1 domain-containing protein n=1 Tax=Timema douglasi TaxID=61478 RepID=A0A7R8ZAV6_TIMDO|nr:unnamed protein product [Timema douglasi]